VSCPFCNLDGRRAWLENEHAVALRDCYRRKLDRVVEDLLWSDQGIIVDPEHIAPAEVLKQQKPRDARESFRYSHLGGGNRTFYVFGGHAFRPMKSGQSDVTRKCKLFRCQLHRLQ